MVNQNRVLFAFVLALIQTSTMAENLIFYGQMPLVNVSETGALSAFQLEANEVNTAAEMADKVRLLWSYQLDKKPAQVTVEVVDIDQGCERGLGIESSDGNGGLLASQKLLRMPKKSQSLNSKLTFSGKKILMQELKRYAIKPRLLTQLISSAVITPVAMKHRRRTSLLITAANEKSGQSVNALIIVSINRQDELTVSLREIKVGSSSDTDGYAGKTDLLMSTDLNDDGNDELILSSSAYESYGYDVLSWDGEQWARHLGGGGGC